MSAVEPLEETGMAERRSSLRSRTGIHSSEAQLTQSAASAARGSVPTGAGALLARYQRARVLTFIALTVRAAHHADVAGRARRTDRLRSSRPKAISLINRS